MLDMIFYDFKSHNFQKLPKITFNTDNNQLNPYVYFFSYNNPQNIREKYYIAFFPYEGYACLFNQDQKNKLSRLEYNYKDFCYPFIVDQSNYIKKNEKSLKEINSLTLIIGDNCNSNCIYCYNKNQETRYNKYNFKNFLKIIKKICKRYNIKNIFFFSNGEPTLYWEKFRQILDATRNFDINYQLTTNGVISNQEVLNEILIYNFSILISIDGMERIHNFHRPLKKNENSYNQVKKFIEWCVDNLDRNNKIFSRTTITKYNVDDLIPIAHYLSNLGIKNQRFEKVWNVPELEPNIKKFMHNIVKLQIYTDYNNINLSGSYFPSSSSQHYTIGCNSFSGENLVISESGDVSFCLSPNKYTIWGEVKNQRGHIKLQYYSKKKDIESQREILTKKCYSCPIQCIGPCMNPEVESKKENMIWCNVKLWILTQYLKRKFDKRLSELKK
ncbi:MAG: radical SAM protein [Candidatus Lokiarchaeota archaeon]|nr:radical SAM protein [Candidatus Lokiarchaeota archaeon]